MQQFELADYKTASEPISPTEPGPKGEKKYVVIQSALEGKYFFSLQVMKGFDCDWHCWVGSRTEGFSIVMSLTYGGGGLISSRM